jgi:hypothetical protein
MCKEFVAGVPPVAAGARPDSTRPASLTSRFADVPTRRDPLPRENSSPLTIHQAISFVNRKPFCAHAQFSRGERAGFQIFPGK